MREDRRQRTEGSARSELDGVCPQITQSYAEGDGMLNESGSDPA